MKCPLIPFWTGKTEAQRGAVTCLRAHRRRWLAHSNLRMLVPPLALSRVLPSPYPVLILGTVDIQVLYSCYGGVGGRPGHCGG